MNNTDHILEPSREINSIATPETLRLRQLINIHAPTDGRFYLPLDDVHLVRESKINTTSKHSMTQFGVCIVAQGIKRVILGKEIYEYDISNMVVYSLTVPVATNIIKANEEEPYLCMVINIDPQKLAELILKVFPNGIDAVPKTTSVHLAYRQPEILDAAIRLLELLSKPADLKLIAPLIMDEILIRLLHSPIGSALAQVGKSSANLNKIIKTISYIRENVSQTITVDCLSKTANMSQSSFHQHFKAITSVSPLQFQKILRLQQAKHLILSKGVDVGSASSQVGYASISQFSREYNRFFGNPPSKDISN